jgi:ribosomal protein S27AE
MAKKQFGLKAILLGDIDMDKLGNGNGNGNGHASESTATAIAPHAGALTAPTHTPTATAVLGRAKAAADELLSQYKLKCPECGAGTLAFMEGCVKCGACGYSKC